VLHAPDVSSPPLLGQTALVLGGTGRVGSATAAALSAHGARVVIHYGTRGEQARGMVDDLAVAAWASPLALQADLTDEDGLHALVRQVEEQCGSLEILVNTVHGQFDPKPVADMGWGDWTVHLAAVQGHFLICKATLPLMRRQRYGRIVYVSAGLSTRFFAGCSAYSTAKAGLNAFCKTLALEEGRHGITVNIVAPGKISVSDGRASTDHPQAWEAMNQATAVHAPLGREATLDDVSGAILYFVSPTAGGITGQTLVVAGGEIMSA